MKTDTPLIETPQSVTVVTRDLMDAQGTQGLSSALRYIAGVNAETQGWEPSRDWSMAIRGFDATSYGLLRDGLFWDPYTQTDTYLLDRIEVLKGPSSVLYGMNTPSGMINMVTKKPPEEAQHEVEFDLGNFSRKQVKADLGGPLDDSGHWFYRVVMLYRDSDTQVDHLPDDRVLIAPSITWKPNEETSLTLRLDYQHDNGSWIQFLPAYGTLLPNPNGRIPVSLDLGQPYYDYMHRWQSDIGYELSHRFGDAWTFSQNLRLAQNKTDLKFTYYGDGQYGGFLDPEMRQIVRYPWTYNPSGTAYTLDNHLQGHWRNGDFEYTLLAGVDLLHYHQSIHGAYASEGVPLDLYAPDYGPRIAPDTPFFSLDTVNQAGIYLQNQLKIGSHWVAVLGGRQDWATNDASSGGDPSHQLDRHFSGRAGLVYLTDAGFAPYVSFSQSFLPNAGTNFYGQPYKPTDGTQYEAGLKFMPTGSPLSATLSVFRITESNVQAPDPDNPQNTLQVGEERSKGAELEVHASLSESLDLVASYTYNPVEITKSTIVSQIGTMPTQTPMHQAALWADYTVHSGAVRGLGFGAGVRRIGETFGGDGDATYPELNVPGYTLFDAMVHYDLEHWRLALNASNLTDKTYVAACQGVNGCYYGYRRTVMGSARYSW